MTEEMLTIERADPKRLIRESFCIDGITTEECRSIFVDWALSLPQDVGATEAARLVLEAYAPKAVAGEAAHPMVQVLVEGARTPDGDKPRRRGGRAGRFDE